MFNFKNFSLSFLKNYDSEKDKLEYNYKKLTSNFTESFFELTVFSLKKIFDFLNLFESFFICEVKKQLSLEEKFFLEDEKLEHVRSVFEALINSNNKEADLFYSSYDKKQETLVNNCCFMELPSFTNSISLQIDNFFYNISYFFNIVVDCIEDSSFVQKKFPILPYKFSGEYLESISFKNSVYTSTFEVLSNYKIQFLDSNRNVLEIPYQLSENKIIIKEEDFLYSDGCEVSYTPFFDSAVIPVNAIITKIFLDTDFDKTNKKKIIFTGVDSAYV